MVRRLVLGLMLAVLWVGACESAFAMGHSRTESTSPRTVKQSNVRFSLPDMEGNTVTMNGLLENHKVVLLNFWATWCPYCVEEIPDLVKLQEKFTGKSFTVVGVNSGESQEDVARYLKKRPVNYPILLDEDNAVSSAYGVTGLPTSFLVRADGKVVSVSHSISPQLESDIEALLQ